MMTAYRILSLTMWTGMVVGVPFAWQIVGSIYGIIGMIPAIFIFCFAGEFLFGNYPDLVGSARNDAMINDLATTSLICGGMIVWLVGCGLCLSLTGKSKKGTI
jgi:hypothetical protein